MTKRAFFPLGHDITLEELDRDPYPVFARLREHEPISWVPALNMWYVVRYEDVRTALFDAGRLTTASPQSTIFGTFGAQILTTEGATHDRYREATRHPFAPGFIRTHLETAIREAAAALVDGFKKEVGPICVRRLPADCRFK
jgi:cytochrome P450